MVIPHRIAVLQFGSAYCSISALVCNFKRSLRVVLSVLMCEPASRSGAGDASQFASHCGFFVFDFFSFFGVFDLSVKSYSVNATLG